jgi:hypothetical protein
MLTFKLLRAALAATLVIAGAVQPAAAQQSADTEASDRAAFEEGLRQSPGGALIEAMRRHYPDEANPLLERTFQQIHHNPDDLPAALATLRRDMQVFLGGRASDLASAPTPRLLDVARRRLAAARLLQQEDPELCAEWALGSIRNAARLSPAGLAQITELAVAMVEAAGAGKATPVRRASEPAPAVLTAWLNHLRAADGQPDTMALIGNPSRFASVLPARRCQLTVAMYDAVMRMGEADAGDMMALFLATEMRQIAR